MGNSTSSLQAWWKTISPSSHSRCSLNQMPGAALAKRRRAWPCRTCNGPGAFVGIPRVRRRPTSSSPRPARPTNGLAILTLRPRSPLLRARLRAKPFLRHSPAHGKPPAQPTYRDQPQVGGCIPIRDERRAYRRDASSSSTRPRWRLERRDGQGQAETELRDHGRRR
jgi:hypothetical protein